MKLIAPIPARSEVWVARGSNDALCVAKRPITPHWDAIDEALPVVHLEDDWMMMPFYKTSLKGIASQPLDKRIDVAQQLLNACLRWSVMGLNRFDLKLEHLFEEDGRLIVVDAFLSDNVKGSVKYASMHSLLGIGYDSSGDTFCAGMLIHEILSGEMPFAGKRMGTLYSKAAQKKKISPKIPESLVPFLEKALHEDLAERYHSFHNMVNDFKNL